MVIQGITTPTSTVYWCSDGVKVVVDENGTNCTRCDGHVCKHIDMVRGRLSADAKRQHGMHWNKRETR